MSDAFTGHDDNRDEAARPGDGGPFRVLVAIASFGTIRSTPGSSLWTAESSIAGTGRISNARFFLPWLTPAICSPTATKDSGNPWTPKRMPRSSPRSVREDADPGYDRPAPETDPDQQETRDDGRNEYPTVRTEPGLLGRPSGGGDGSNRIRRYSPDLCPRGARGTRRRARSRHRSVLAHPGRVVAEAPIRRAVSGPGASVAIRSRSSRPREVSSASNRATSGSAMHARLMGCCQAVSFRVPLTTMPQGRQRHSQRC